VREEMWHLPIEFLALEFSENPEENRGTIIWDNR
jgi:hypothetical protein